MEINIYWTETALNNLENIFEYYKNHVSFTVAKKITKKLVMSTLNLKIFPEIGAKEELLEDRLFEYRYLVEGNYKIIYWQEGSYVKIATVFDTRQNPDKLASYIHKES